MYLESDHDGMLFDSHQDFERSSVRQRVKRGIASADHAGNREHALIAEPSELVLEIARHPVADLAGSVPLLRIGLLRFSAQHLRSHAAVAKSRRSVRTPQSCPANPTVSLFVVPEGHEKLS